VGGTNPSLLEAMASDCFIFAHDNIFNRAVLKENSYYYSNSQDVANLLNRVDEIAESDKDKFIAANLDEIRTNYSWEHLVDEHEKYFYWILEEHQKKMQK
jgi:glycosyltransferase involved in cell wall biosynthesis